MATPNLNILVTADGSSLRSTMQGASTAVRSAADEMASGASRADAAFTQLAASTLNAAEASRVARDTLKALASGELPQNTRAVNDLALAQKEASEAARRLAAAQREVKAATGQTTAAMGSGVQQAALLSRTFGLNLGRGMEQIIARTPALAMAVQAMLPITLAVAFAEMAYRGWEKLDEVYTHAAEAADKIRENTELLIARANVHADAIEVQNARLQEQINKLSGKPGNGLAIGLAEARERADQLTASLREAVSQEEKLMKEQHIGAGGSLLSGQAETGDTEEVIKGWNKQIAEMSAAGKSAKEIHDQMAVYMEQAKQKAAELKSLKPSSSGSITGEAGDDPSAGMQAPPLKQDANIALFERFAERMKTGRRELEDESTKITLEGEEKRLQAQKRSQEQAAKATESADKLKNFQAELRANGMGNMADSLVKLPDAAQLENLRHIMAEVKKNHEELAKYTRDEVPKQTERPLDHYLQEQKLLEEQKRMAEENRQIQDSANAAKRDRSLGGSEAEEARVHQQAATGGINEKQELQQLAAIHAQMLQTEQQYIAQKIAIDSMDPKALAKDLDERAKLENKARVQRINDETKELQLREQGYRDFVQRISGSMFSGVNMWLQHQKTFSQAMKHEWNSIAMGAIQSIEKVAVKKLVTNNLMKLWDTLFHAHEVTSNAASAGAIEATNAMRFATQQAALDTAAASMVADNVASAQSYAATAGAAALASIAAIPVVGPGIAPGVAAGIVAEGESFAGMAAFDYGGIMPATGVALVHQGEGVLTAPATQMLQTVMNQVNNGNNSSSRGGDVINNFHHSVNAIDGESVSRSMRRNTKQLVKEVSRAVRLGRMGSAR